MILAQHPDIFITPQKETHYFTRLYGQEDLVFYETRYFQGQRGQRAVGELTPDYMRHPEVPKRIRDSLTGNVKLIFCLRDPVARAFSHYLQCVRILIERESFARAIKLEQDRLAQDYFNGMRRLYIGAGLYSGQIQRFLEVFPKEQMFFMVLEQDFLVNRAKAVERLLDFLGLDTDPSLNLDVRNTSLPPPTIRIVGPGDKVVWKSATGESTLPAGAIVLRTGNSGLDRVVVAPSQGTHEYFLQLQQNMTQQLTDELAADIYQRHFRDEVSRMETLLDRDLSGWHR